MITKLLGAVPRLQGQFLESISYVFFLAIICNLHPISTFPLFLSLVFPWDTNLILLSLVLNFKGHLTYIYLTQSYSSIPPIFLLLENSLILNQFLSFCFKLLGQTEIVLNSNSNCLTPGRRDRVTTSGP